MERKSVTKQIPKMWSQMRPHISKPWVLPLISILLSIVALLYSYQAIQSSENMAKVSLYNAFKARFETIISNAPENRNNPEYVLDLLKGSKDWQYFVDYWYHSFNEWYASQAIPGNFAKDLWNDYYGPAQQLALLKPHYLRVLCDKIKKRPDGDKSTSFAGKAIEYRQALLRLYTDGDTAPECLVNQTAYELPASLPSTNGPILDERDEILMLLTYSIVYKNWQDGKITWKKRRGHNIGAILVNSEGTPVFWARNANIISGNSSQHAEVRVIRNFLENQPERYLKKFTLYSSLESCAMCTGMMALTNISRVIFGQRDKKYGQAYERLFKSNYNKYPRDYKSDRSNSTSTEELDKAFMKSGNDNITDWLSSDDARSIYKMAARKFTSYRVQHPENKQVYEEAKKFLNGVSKNYVKLPH